MDYASEVTLPDYKRGDRWPGMAVGPVTFDGQPPSGTLTRVRMHFVKSGGGTFKFDSQTGDRDAPISITNASTWTVSVPAADSFLQDAGVWHWDMEFYQSGYGAPLTLYKGSITVHDDVTR